MRANESEARGRNGPFAVMACPVRDGAPYSLSADQLEMSRVLFRNVMPRSTRLAQSRVKIVRRTWRLRAAKSRRAMPHGKRHPSSRRQPCLGGLGWLGTTRGQSLFAIGPCGFAREERVNGLSAAQAAIIKPSRSAARRAASCRLWHRASCAIRAPAGAPASPAPDRRACR